jgi:peptidylprolyl isomerase
LARLVLATLGSLLTIAVAGLAAQAAERSPDAEDTVILQLDDGPIVIELTPQFAPATTAQFKRLVREGFYDGLNFYRVIDGFVAQGGDGSDMSEEENAEPGIKAEFELDWSDNLSFVTVQSPDLFAPETGFVDGFPAGRDLDTGKVWLTHCPGAVGMARGDTADSGSTDFYIVIGQAPRYLDRNITMFGRVIHGMNVAQQIRRGPPEEGGMISNLEESSVIRSAHVLSDMAANERPTVVVADTNSEAFAQMVKDRRHRKSEWFIKTPPAVLDVCQIPNQGRLQR